MALIQCPDCKRDITSTSEKCGYCGYQLKPIIDDEDENKAHYLLIGARIFLIVLTLIIIVAVFGNFKKCSRNNIEQEAIPPQTDSVKINLSNPDTLLAKAKAFYKGGKYNDADIVLTQIINHYKNSSVTVEASKLKIIVINEIRNKWNSDQKIRELERKKAEKKRQQELEQIYVNDPIRYYKIIYGAPDSEDDFVSGSYTSKTLVWHCVAGKYRSVNFVLKYGSWTKESEYTSDCI